MRSETCRLLCLKIETWEPTTIPNNRLRCVSLLAGSGGSTQHPLASAGVSRTYGERARGPLGTYNFAGDLGKATLRRLLCLHPIVAARSCLCRPDQD
jgi:hypothetical protein